MPTVATVNGVKIEIYADEHPPPHFHARFAEFIAMIAIEDLEVLEGDLPPPQLRLSRISEKCRAVFRKNPAKSRNLSRHSLACQ